MPVSKRFTPCRYVSRIDDSFERIDEESTGNREVAEIRAKDNDADFILLETFNPFGESPEWNEVDRITELKEL